MLKWAVNRTSSTSVVASSSSVYSNNARSSYCHTSNEGTSLERQNYLRDLSSQVKQRKKRESPFSHVESKCGSSPLRDIGNYLSPKQSISTKKRRLQNRQSSVERKKRKMQQQHDFGNCSSLLLENSPHFTIQTSPPEEPQLLFHKPLPVLPVNISIAGVRKCCTPSSSLSGVSPLARKLTSLELTSKSMSISGQYDEDSHNWNVSLHSDSSAGVITDSSIDTPVFERSDLIRKTRRRRKIRTRKTQKNAGAETAQRKRQSNVMSLCNDINSLEDLENKSATEENSTNFSVKNNITDPVELLGENVDQFIPSTSAIRRSRQSYLTLPDGIPSPFYISRRNFNIKSPSLEPFTLTKFANPCSTLSLTCGALFEDDKISISSSGAKPSSDPSTSFLMSSEEKKNSWRNKKVTNVEESVPGSECGFPSSMLFDESPSLVPPRSTPLDSRRKLFPTSPSASSNRCLDNTVYGHESSLDLHIYTSDSILTVFVIRARNLRRACGSLISNAYVKVNLLPYGNKNEGICGRHHYHQDRFRTCVRRSYSGNPRFNHTFHFTLQDLAIDLEKRKLLISVWHRDRGNRKSEFLGCISFHVKNILRKDIIGSYRLLLWQSSSNSSKAASFQKEPTYKHCSFVGGITANFVDCPTPSSVESKMTHCSGIYSKERIRSHENTGDEEYTFLRHLELDPIANQNEDSVVSTENKHGGRTPFTTTYKLKKDPGTSFGFSVAWTQPPRVERVENNLPADVAGLRSGDYIVFANKTNVVTLSEQQTMDLIRESGDQLTLEVFRKPFSNCVSNHRTSKCEPASLYSASSYYSRSTSSTKPSQLHMPRITFNSEVGSGIIV